MRSKKKKIQSKPVSGPSDARVLRVAPDPEWQITAVVEQLQGMAEYKRKDETEALIPARNIVTELDNRSNLNKRRAYMLCWLVPDPQNNRGALLSVDEFHLTIENAGVYDVSVTLQQPHGHEQCPTSIAAWVQISSHTIKAGSTTRHTIKPVNSNLVVPYRIDLSGADALCFAAFSAARQGMSTSGGNVTYDEVGLRLRMEAIYKASGNSLQGGNFFGMRTYDDDSVMTAVDSKPPVPIAIRDVGDGIKRMGWAARGKDTHDVVAVFYSGAAGTEPVHLSRVTGLSTNHIYRLPYPVVGSGTGLYIRYSPSFMQWYVIDVPDKSEKDCLKYTGLEPPYMGVYSDDCMLIPLSKYTFSINCKRSGPIKPMRCRSVGGGQSPLLLGSWRDDFLKALSFVVSVIKVASAVAGAAGLMNVVEREEEVEGGFVLH